MPFGWGESHDAYQQAYTDGEPQHEGKLSHEVLAGGAAFAAMKYFEDKQRKEGKPVSHQFAKELIAGFAGAEIDKLAETKGEDFYDRERAKRHAKEQAEHLYDQHYGGQDQYDPNQAPPERLQREFGEDRWSN